MKVGERGQVTIPQELRERFGLLPKTEVEFIVEEGALKLVKKGEERKAQIRSLYGRKQLPKSTDELMNLLRD